MKEYVENMKEYVGIWRNKWEIWRNVWIIWRNMWLWDIERRSCESSYLGFDMFHILCLAKGVNPGFESTPPPSLPIIVRGYRRMRKEEIWGNMKKKYAGKMNKMKEKKRNEYVGNWRNTRAIKKYFSVIFPSYFFVFPSYFLHISSYFLHRDLEKFRALSLPLHIGSRTRKNFLNNFFIFLHILGLKEIPSFLLDSGTWKNSDLSPS